MSVGRGCVFSVVKEHLCVCETATAASCVHVHCIVLGHLEYVGRGDNLVCSDSAHMHSTFPRG